MTKYRKKPIEIEAIRITDENYHEIAGLRDVYVAVAYGASTPWMIVEVTINTLEGEMTAPRGDWIIKGIEGELYPCKNSIFEKTYEKVE